MRHVSAIALLLTTGMAMADDSPDRHFATRVKPLLDSRCVSCHGPDKVKGGLRLDSREAVLRGGESGPALVPGSPDKSLLVQAVMHSRKDLEMPPKEKLTPADVAVFERWIRDGVPWPREEAAQAFRPKAVPGETLGDAWSDARNPIVQIFNGQRLDLWSLKPPGNPRVPAVRNKRWLRNGIDQFILARLETAGLTPAREADRRSLARRLYFDLTGLPPSPAEMEAFLRDDRSDAYERLVDALLASPRYGEHWARMWLDVVRYSDSNGFDWDEYRPKAWRFRDYVIGAFNADKPFDRFIHEQLAGDELVDGAPRTKAEQDALVATGYLRMGPQDNSAPLFNEQARARAELMADLVETTGSAFLGLTMSCCRCHDHKYDPLSQADHYRMRAFFEPVKYADDTPLDLDTEQEEIRRHNAAIDPQIESTRRERDGLVEPVKKRLKDERIAKLPTEDRALLEIPETNRTDAVKAKLKPILKQIEPAEADVMAAFSAEQKEQHQRLTKSLDSLKAQRRSFNFGLLMTDSTNDVPETRILFQGDHKQEKEPVSPGFLSALDPNPAGIVRGSNSITRGRRLTLAKWITAPGNPLTARVLVNRVWQGYFGRGLVATPNDFGLAGSQPTHPELLDWLASHFMRENWSLKELHRLIATSATYRQASVPVASGADARKREKSAREPRFAARTGFDQSLAPARGEPFLDDSLYQRQRLRRLSAEQLRDAILAVSGLLTNKHGGPPVWPELPAEILQANPAFLDDNAEKTKGWYPSPKPEQFVRSVYLVQKRTVRVPFMETFDLPENSTSCARRAESVVAPQALSLLNSPLAIEAAKAFADRVRREAGENPGAQVDRAFALALQRKPLPGEREACLALHESRSLIELCRALLNLNEFVYLD